MSNKQFITSKGNAFRLPVAVITSLVLASCVTTSNDAAPKVGTMLHLLPQTAAAAPDSDHHVEIRFRPSESEPSPVSLAQLETALDAATIEETRIVISAGPDSKKSRFDSVMSAMTRARMVLKTIRHFKMDGQIRYLPSLPADTVLVKIPGRKAGPDA